MGFFSQWTAAALASLAVLSSPAAGAPASPAPAAAVRQGPISTAEDAKALFSATLQKTISAYGLSSETSLFVIRAEFDPRNPRRAVLSGAATNREALAALCASLAGGGLILENAVRVLPEKLVMADRIWAIVSAPEAPLRPMRPADLDADGAAPIEKQIEKRPAAASLSLGMPVKLYAKDASGQLRLASSPDGRLGWLRAQDLFIGTDASLLAWNRRAKVIVTAPDAVLYPAKGDGNALIGEGEPVPMGAILAQDGGLVLEDAKSPTAPQSHWRVRLPSGEVRWLERSAAAALPDFEEKTEVLRRTEPAKFLAQIAQSAKSLKGRSMSESAFLRASFLSGGLVIPSQAERAAYIERPRHPGKGRSAVRAGDLLVLGSRQDQKPKHVGIALGRGQGAAVADGVVRVMPIAALEKALGALLWTERLDASQLANPCMLSTRSHPYWQTPPAELSPCRLRPHG